MQAKLAINRPGDQYEREADRVAEQVMRTALPAPAKTDTAAAYVQTGVQRACACGGTCDQCKGDQPDAGTEHLQRKPAGQSLDSTTAPPIVHDVLGSANHPLDPATRAFMEPRFGYDLSKVRIHDDDKAAASAKVMNARAYTVGHSIVFSRRDRPSGDAASHHLMAHEIAHVIQQRGASPTRAIVMRAPAAAAKVPPPVPALPDPCTFTCTDPAFTALSPPDREQLFNQSCAKGYPPDNTFFGQPIPGATSGKLRSKLLAAAARAKRIMCLAGKNPNAYQLDRSIGTYEHHSPSKSRAVDIDLYGQTYILHEASPFKENVEDQVSPVYHRIAFWSHGAKSIIPLGIKTVDDKVPKGAPDARTWSNPETGRREAVTTGELYDKLSAESIAMTRYFELLTKSDADLQQQIQSFVDQHQTDAKAAKKLGLPFSGAAIDVPKFRRSVANDYRLLGGSRSQLKNFAGELVAKSSSAPPTIKTPDGKNVELDRPFRNGSVAGATNKGVPDPAANRRPELGFLTLPKEVVVALTQEGLAWGAIDFGGGSGDVMHFDCRREVSGC